MTDVMRKSVLLITVGAFIILGAKLPEKKPKTDKSCRLSFEVPSEFKETVRSECCIDYAFKAMKSTLRIKRLSAEASLFKCSSMAIERHSALAALPDIFGLNIEKYTHGEEGYYRLTWRQLENDVEIFHTSLYNEKCDQLYEIHLDYPTSNANRVDKIFVELLDSIRASKG